MIDFRKVLNNPVVEKKVNPIEIYDILDRSSITGPLRPVQTKILNEWFENRKDEKDLIIKLHTGEGKTLIGLLILQSKLNSSKGPCLYICPNKYLVNQVKEDAHKFGIPVCEINEDNSIPDDFLAGRKILIVHIQKVFNGKSIFGVGNNYIKTGCVILDDAHACIDSIKSSFTMKIPKNHMSYNEILQIFEEDLVEQGQGTYIEILEGVYDSFLPISYWAWIDKVDRVLRVLSKYKDDNIFKFIWDLLKDNLEKCQAFVSGSLIEISPIHLAVEKFGTFSNANCRILMSATTQDDSFFIKGLGMNNKSVQNILLNPDKKWSGEKMLLIPSLIHDELVRDKIISLICRPLETRKYGIVSIVSSFSKAKLYYDQKALTPSAENVIETINNLKNGSYDKCVVLTNRYDGIDLPDDTCRLLVLDGRPNFASLTDKYEETARINSDYYNIKTAQKIEQGLGRSVRGEKDYSVIMIISADLVKFIKSSQTNKYFSKQTNKQIEIGLKIAELAASVSADEIEPIKGLISLVRKSLDRDEGWKDFYISEMNSISSSKEGGYNYNIFELEREASKKYYHGDYEVAANIIQKIIDDCINYDDLEKGWFLQLKARYLYKQSKLDSSQLQKSAFLNNIEVLKPKEGIVYKKLSYINENRNQRIKDYLKTHNNYPELILHIDEVVSELQFGVPFDKFEIALQKLGAMLGFLSERPDKQIKKGPDNLWCLSNNDFIVFECKSEVSIDRSEIVKSEVGQMNNHCGWFYDEYGQDTIVKFFMIIPTRKVAYNAHFTHKIEVIKRGKLKTLRENVRSFFKEFKPFDLHEITTEKIQEFIIMHQLDIDSIKNIYSEQTIRG